MRVFDMSGGENGLNAVLSSLRKGGVIGFPTDTAYGIGVDPFDARAVERVFTLKGRDSGKPILLLVDSLDMARSVAHTDDVFERVARSFWPGPLTLIARALGNLPLSVTAGTGTVGLRQPASPRWVLDVISALGGPLTATSANRTGHPPARSSAEVAQGLGDGIDILVEGGTLAGPTSTVLDLTCDPPELLREGAISYNDLLEFLGGRVERHSP